MTSTRPACHPIGDIVNFALDRQVKLTLIEIGFNGFVNENESVLTLHAGSEGVMEHCKTKEKSGRFPVEGAGLGPPIVKKIVKAHGGRIRIMDNSDRELTFRLEMPAP